MRKLARLTLTLLLALPACGEGGGTTEPQAEAHVGTYTLATVNGASLPVTFTEQGLTVAILSGRVTLNAAGGASDTYRYRITEGGTTSEETTTDLGRYTRTRDVITVIWNSGETEVFVYANNTLTLDETGFIAVYRK